ncbi:uncharacterized protein LOC127732826 [Mytilus californianus]|uniref:uncharacterized protein LOC127700949 n=1 Tax=Mytilus californianus TaxID=6549 RepID=UPI002248521C|nr:uncharacterized protein LOC127700949 [Mytilus californianus]XP_052096592.1 uncharacterized protein LOC127731792 [Mytilus californianus]XP_052097965.1 uncharacterized protein LOC127732826 [Mytilus californianus]
MDITNDRSRETEHVAESDPEDLEEGVTLEAIDCLVKYEIQKSENNIHKELTEFRKQYSNNAIGELRAHLDEVKKEVNRNAQGCDTGFNDLTATVNSMETTISQIETESKGSKRKIQELEKKVTDIDRKFNDITAGIPKIIEDIITSGTLAFMPTNSFDIDESVDEPMTIMSTPVSMSTNLITEHAEDTSQKRAVDEGVKKTKKKLLLRWSWKKSNPAGLEFLESRIDLPDFSRAQDFKLKVYKEGIQRGLWIEATHTFVRVCTKIDNLHKQTLK